MGLAAYNGAVGTGRYGIVVGVACYKSTPPLFTSDKWRMVKQNKTGDRS
jgi:hypothetical protein